MSYKNLKLSLLIVLLGTSLSAASWAMELHQEDRDQYHHVGESIGNTQAFVEEDIEGVKLPGQSISEYIEDCHACVESLKTQFPHSYYMGSIHDVSKMESLTEEALCPYYRGQQEILDASTESLKKVFPYSYYLRKN